jgi:hypothetical protein
MVLLFLVEGHYESGVHHHEAGISNGARGRLSLGEGAQQLHDLPLHVEGVSVEVLGGDLDDLPIGPARA